MSRNMKEKLKQYVKKSKLYEYFAEDIYKYLYHKKYSVFGYKSDKKALLSYRIIPFISDKNVDHSNTDEAKAIARVLVDIGYEVDVFGVQYDKDIDYSKYDIIVGQGYPIENSFYKNYTGYRVYLATGESSKYRNYAEMDRLRAIENRRGRLLKPRRIKKFPDFASSTLSDGILCTGNGTADTYRDHFDGPIYQIPVTVPNKVPPVNNEKKVDKCTPNFMWLGSSGLAHKGLDLCVEAFHKIENKKLHICGPFEGDFFDEYKGEINKNENIEYHGWVDISSKKYENIVDECMFSLFPSCSEGESGSVLTTMKSGLIPIVTPETGINFSEFGFGISEPTVSDVLQAVNECSQLSPQKIKELSSKCSKYVSSKHIIGKYENKARKAILDIIE